LRGDVCGCNSRQLDALPKFTTLLVRRRMTLGSRIASDFCCLMVLRHRILENLLAAPHTEGVE